MSSEEYNRKYRLEHPELKYKKREYYKNNKEKCKEYQDRYKLKHSAEIKERKDKYNKNHPDRNHNRNPNRARAYKLKTKYGITVEEYNSMFDNQKGCCAICGMHQSELKRTLCVDHSHKTGNIRGLLCDRCNYMLGVFEDKIELFVSATEYLIKNK